MFTNMVKKSRFWRISHADFFSSSSPNSKLQSIIQAQSYFHRQQVKIKCLSLATCLDPIGINHLILITKPKCQHTDRDDSMNSPMAPARPSFRQQQLLHKIVLHLFCSLQFREKACTSKYITSLPPNWPQTTFPRARPGQKKCRDHSRVLICFGT